MNDDRLHVARIDIDAPAELVFDFMADPTRLALWAIGLADQHIIAPMLVQGRLQADNQPYYCQLSVAAEQGVVVYHLGQERSALVPRISALVSDASGLGYAQTQLSLLAWRTKDMDEPRWQSLMAGHDREVIVIRRTIEGDQSL